jgi:uncharacterized protein YecE (DUF72 family)
VAVSVEDIRIGTAGWNVPLAHAERVDPAHRGGSSLARYARLLPASEVNTSFYRHHRTSTWARWAASTPPGFRFSCKLPRAVTHDARLDPARSAPIIDRLLEEIAPLGAKAGPLLVQLPPSFEFDAVLVGRFLEALRERWSGAVVCEPRHASWFDDAAGGLLADQHVARVAADPARVPAAATPGGWNGLAYVRLHGSPRMYYSEYTEEFLDTLAGELRALAAGPAEQIWCIFDNTAGGAALGDALRLRERLVSPTAVRSAS